MRTEVCFRGKITWLCGKGRVFWLEFVSVDGGEERFAKLFDKAGHEEDGVAGPRHASKSC